MPSSPRLRARLVGLEKAFPRRCPACVGRPRIDGMLFRYNGELLSARGERLDESDLEPCTSCGRCREEGIKVLVGVDPAAI